MSALPDGDLADSGAPPKTCGQRNNLQMINILNLDGTVNGACDNEKYVGHDRYEVREMVTHDMQELGHYEGVEDRQIPIKHSDRSKTPVEPCLSDQWFVKMDDVAVIPVAPATGTANALRWTGSALAQCAGLFFGCFATG